MSVSGIGGADSLYTTYLSILNQANSGGTNSGAVGSGNQPTRGGENTFMQGECRVCLCASLSRTRLNSTTFVGILTKQ